MSIKEKGGGKITVQQDIGENAVARAAQGFEDVFECVGDCFKILDMIPINIIIFTANGTAVFVNKEFCQSYGNIDPKKLVGVYNFFKDPVLASTYKVEDFFRKVFKGDAASVSLARIDLEKMPSRFLKSDVQVSESRIDQIFGSPIYDKEKKMKYAVFTSYATTVFEGEAKTMKAQEYMYEHWLEDFNLDLVAKSCGLSKYYFSHFFKKNTGQTPYGYYKQIKINKLKEMLLNPQMSIAEAFRECGLDYKGQYGRFFKAMLGMTPSEYRKKALQNK